ncbi:hypothetical protein R1sor_023440 [Riccia sorocarpa]|uniref:Uncharacterized protein n=1 Tax=Riccia sorocarpa TaxID=122646 RepID=A0ABD3GRT6_9MARC
MTLPGAAAAAFEKVKSRSLCCTSFLDSIAIPTEQKKALASKSPRFAESEDDQVSLEALLGVSQPLDKEA